MKMNVEIDCTPEEARTFLGLPDLKPLQTAVLAQMEQQMLSAAEQFSPDALLRSWMSLWPTNPDQMREMFGRFLGMGMGRSSGGGNA